MNNFLEATRIDLRVQTSQGNLNIAQMWQLKLAAIATILKNLNSEIKKSNNDDELSFLDETKTVDKELQLRFDILKEIYQIKKSEADAAKVLASNKEHNEKIYAIISAKKDQELHGKSIEDLMKELK